MKPDVPPVPPELLLGPASVDYVWLATKWIGVALLPIALMAVSAFWAPAAWRDIGLGIGALALATCGLVVIRVSVVGFAALRREQAAGYTTYFGMGLDYWQLEVKTGKVLRRPGERTVHREGIPRTSLSPRPTGAFHVEQVGDARWRSALDHFAAGGGLVYDDVGFALQSDGPLLVRPHWRYQGRRPSLEEATAAFRNAEWSLGELQAQDARFAELTARSSVEMELIADERTAGTPLARRDADGAVRLT